MSGTDQPLRRSPSDAMRELRLRMLNAPASELGIRPTNSFPRVYGVLMDWPVDDMTVTVVSLADGNASLYTTSTFGVIGGIGHTPVRAEAARFVTLAEKQYDGATPTNDYRYPKAGRVRFYLVAFGGVRMIESDETTLKSGRGQFASLWEQGQRVLTGLRLATEKKKEA